MPRKTGSDEILQLSKIIGLTTFHGSAITSCPNIEGFIYAAGSVAIHYSVKDDEQVAFYSATKPISSLAISQDGRFLAIGERGHQPGIIIWNLLKNEKVLTLQGHKNGIGCLSFSPNGRYLVSIGFKPDKQLILWDWDQSKQLSTQRVGNKVYSVSFHHSGNYFVTGGDRHLKWWYVTEVLEGEAVGLEGKPASINEEHRNSTFVEVICGYGGTEGKTFCATSQGILCCFNEDRLVERWVKLETSSAYSMELFSTKDAAGLLVVGCANGAIRAFLPSTLDYIATLPRPIPLGEASIDLDSSVTREDSFKYAACYALRQAAGSKSDPIPKLAAIYADRSLIVWDIVDIFSAKRFRSFLSHRGCVWDIQFLEKSQIHPFLQEEIFPNDSNKLPAGSFTTCSADNTIRFWSISSERAPVHASLARSGKNVASHPYSEYSSEMLDFIEFGSAEDGEGKDTAPDHSRLDDSRSLVASTATGFSITNVKVSAVEFDYSKGTPDLEIPDRPQSSFAPRAIAIHPFGHQVVCGDRTGKLRIYDLSTMKLVHAIQAHSAEILTLTFSPPLVTLDHGNTWILYSSETMEEEEKMDREDVLVLLATAGRDRLIHLFHANNLQSDGSFGYTPLDTLDRHSSSVTSLRFSFDGKQLISCSGDKTIVFNELKGPHVIKYKTIPTPTGTINGLAVEVSNKFAITSGQDKRIHIWNLAQQRFMRAHKSSQLNHELYKTDIDPSGSFIVTSGFDKSLTLLDFFSGEVLCQLYGHHSELITGVKFSPDGSHLVTVGGDGCIFIWKTSSFLLKSMKDRLMELFTKAQKRNNKALIRQGSISASVASLPTEPSHIPAKSPSRPATTGHESANNAGVQSSLSNLKMKIHNKQGPEVAADHSTMASSGLSQATSSTIASNVTQNKKNRWQENLEKEKGYELAGKRIEIVPPLNNVGNAHGSAAVVGGNRNKFTLELTSSVLDEKTIRPSDLERVQPKDQDESGSNLVIGEGVADESTPTTDNIDSNNSAAVLESSILAATHEAKDGVNLPDVSSSEDEDEETEKLFKSLDEYESDFEVSSPDKSKEINRTGKSSTASSHHSHSALDVQGGIVEEEDKELASSLDHLEKSARNLESWLEEMLRNDSKLDESVPANIKSSSSPNSLPPSAASGRKAEDNNHNDVLNTSLSSAFFRGLKSSSANPGEGLLPIPPLVNAENPDSSKITSDTFITSTQIHKEQKLRESAAAMAQMRERLRAMESSSSFSKVSLHQSRDLPLKSASKKEKEESGEILYEDIKGKSEYNLRPPAPPVDPASKLNVASVNRSAFFKDSSAHVSFLQDKKKEFEKILSDYNQAKERAMHSYEELLQLQSSFSFSDTASVFGEVAMNDTANIVGTSTHPFKRNEVNSENEDIVLLRESMQETNELVQAFRESLISTSNLPAPHQLLSVNTNGSTRAPGPNSLLLTSTGSSGTLQEIDISQILEQYSNKLLEAFSNKVQRQGQQN